MPVVTTMAGRGTSAVRFLFREDYLWWTHPSVRPQGFFTGYKYPRVSLDVEREGTFFKGVREMLLHQKYPLQISLEGVFQSRLFYLLT